VETRGGRRLRMTRGGVFWRKRPHTNRMMMGLWALLCLDLAWEMHLLRWSLKSRGAAAPHPQHITSYTTTTTAAAVPPIHLHLFFLSFVCLTGFYCQRDTLWLIRKRPFFFFVSLFLSSSTRLVYLKGTIEAEESVSKGTFTKIVLKLEYFFPPLLLPLLLL